MGHGLAPQWPELRASDPAGPVFRACEGLRVFVVTLSCTHPGGREHVFVLRRIADVS